MPARHMPTLDTDQVLAALAQVIETKLVQGEAADVPGLGTFSIEHQPSQLEELPNGEFSIKPPSDTVIFRSKF